MSGNSVHRLSDVYCSQSRVPLPEIKNVNEGINAIEAILERTILCRHDVKELNRIYQLIDHSEKYKHRSEELIGSHGSEYVLEKIINKIKKIAEEKNLIGLISLYHLQRFNDSGLQIEKHFKVLWDFTKTTVMVKSIATYLPCCCLESDFNQDVCALIGPSSDEEVAKILYQKRELQKIGIRQMELHAKKKDEPQRYPSYLDELLNNGYIYLYDHLIQMISNLEPNHESIIQKMTPSDLAFVVLQTTNAIIKKVEKSMPSNHEGKVLLLLGNKNVGKSTTLCFLRGDEMKQVYDKFESETDQNQLIGDGKNLSTLLPNVEVTDNKWVFIDFPGFDHSHGEIVSLGIECALKALINRYDCKGLVLDSILEQSRFDSTSKLAARLERILDNKNHCILGITKYSQDPHFKEIKKIEEEKKEERLQPTEAESKLIGRIKRVRTEDRKKELELELEKKRKERLEKQLPETKQDWDELRKKENQLLNEMQLVSKIELKNLNDPSHVASCLKTLFEAKSLSVKPTQRLDSSIEKLLTEDFKEKLKIELESRKDYQVSYGNFKDFEQKIKETSLINAFLSESNPEIGAFLHLYGFDPRIVSGFDQTIANSCMEKCIKVVMCEVNVSTIKTMLAKFQDEIPELYSKLKKFLEGYIKYILALKASPYEDEKQAETEYTRIRVQYLEAQKEEGKKYEYPTWANVLFGFLLGIPIGINQLLSWLAQKDVKRNKINEYANDLYENISKKHELLMNLRKIQIITINNSEVNNAMNSGPVSGNSIEELNESLVKKIGTVRGAYGVPDWDERITFLANKFSLTSYDPENMTHFSCLLAYACSIIGSRPPFKIERIGVFNTEEVVEENGMILIRIKNLPELSNLEELRNEKNALNRLMSAAALLQFHENKMK